MPCIAVRLLVGIYLLLAAAVTLVAFLVHCRVTCRCSLVSARQHLLVPWLIMMMEFEPNVDSAAIACVCRRPEMPSGGQWMYIRLSESVFIGRSKVLVIADAAAAVC